MNRDAFNGAHPNFLLGDTPLAERDFRENFGLAKRPLVCGNADDEIRVTALLYFPYFRYAQPAWLNKDSQLAIELGGSLLGVTRIPVVMTNIVDATSDWLLNTALDQAIYERNIVSAEVWLPGMPVGQTTRVPVFAGYSGPNSASLVLANQILTQILKASDDSIMSARIGITGKGNRAISVVVDRENLGQTQLVPQLTQLSSGELMVFCMFCAIIRAYEKITQKVVTSLADIVGVVLIDEIDLHLHINLQMEVMPTVISMFPNVQFIVTTHSPFFVLGLTRRFPVVDILLLPKGIRISHAAFSEFQAAYDVFIDEDRQFKRRYDELAAQASQAALPLVITEGKTDWKHVKAALQRLVAAGQIPALQVEFLEYEDRDMGDSRLSQICKDMALLPNARRMIFVFDRDKQSIIDEMTDLHLGYKSWGNNVFSLCIPTPANRRQYQNINIEFFYTDEEIRTIDATTGRRLFFDNEIEVAGLPNRKADIFRVLNPPRVDQEANKKVYDHDCAKIVDGTGQQIAHSKTVFASHILNAAPGFETFGLDSFIPLLETIRTIVQLP